MRGSKSLVSGLVFGLTLCGVAAASPAAPPAKAPVAAEADCQKLGGEVSALIDKNAPSRNLAAARAAFQVGIMDCMEGDDATANKHYADAKNLLGGGLPKAPVAPLAKAPVAVEVDCQKAGGEVSALIDKNAASPNIAAARATFQIGIMECMEGDEATANKHYDDAKKLLTNDAPKAPAIRVPTAG